jgi:DNA-binding response OmpR family regulator
VAVLFVADQRALADVLDGLAAGADDCLSVPFEIDELVARTRAVLRRLSTSAPASRANDVSTGPVVVGRHAIVDRRTGLVQGPAGRIELSRVELRILLHFVACNPSALTTEAVATEVLERRDAAGKGLVHRYISNIRKKLSAVGVDNAIVRSSYGYRLSAGD